MSLFSTLKPINNLGIEKRLLTSAQGSDEDGEYCAGSVVRDCGRSRNFWRDDLASTLIKGNVVFYKFSDTSRRVKNSKKFSDQAHEHNFAQIDTTNSLVSTCLYLDPVRHRINKFLLGEAYSQRLATAKEEWQSKFQEWQKELSKVGKRMKAQKRGFNHTDVDTITLLFLDVIKRIDIQLRGNFYQIKGNGLFWYGGILHVYLSWMKGKIFVDPEQIFIEAARVGLYEAVVDLVEQRKVTVSAKDGNDRTAIMHAARGAHLNILKYLLSKSDPREATSRLDSEGVSALMFASHSGCVECLKLLLRLPDTNVNQQTISAIMYDNMVLGKGLTALGIACYRGHTKCVKELLKMDGIDVNCENIDGFSPLFLATRHPEVVKILFDHPEVDVNLKCKVDATPIMAVAHLGYSETMKLFVRNPKVQINYTTKTNGMTALGMAALEGNRYTLKIMLTHSLIDTSIVCKIGRNALHLAALNGDSDCVSMLMNDPSIRINQKTHAGMTALIIAAECGSITSVQYLVKHPTIDLHVTYRDADGKLSNALTAARSNGHSRIAKILLENGCIEPTV